MRFLKSYAVIVSLILTCMFLSSQAFAQEKIGVLFIQHGGFEQYSEQNLFDSSAHIFAVRPDHPVHNFVLFNPANWGMMLQAGNAPKETGKYSYEYERLGGIDPFPAIIDSQLAQLDTVLNDRADYGTEFIVDYTGWISPGRIEQFPYPRFLYNPPDYISNPDKAGLTYCGEDEAGGPWAGCDPNRYNVDGPAERFIGAGVDRIIAIDLTTSGVRFFKTYDAIEMLKMALADNGRTDIPVKWVNDPNNLMVNSLPTAPTGNWGRWTPDKGEPTTEPDVPLAGNPNPIAADTTLAELLVEGTETSFNPVVTDANTGILILNHATRDYAQYFDPKIDDTLVLNQNIKNELLNRNPDINPANIVGAYMGIKEDGTAEGYAGTERTRNMRGENLGHAWLYQTSAGPETYAAHGLLPADEWGYMYWDALEYLKNQGVEHIVICFPQIVADSVLNLVEQPNQIAKEIGYKNWLYWEEGGTMDNDTYPGVGHPFADYWGIWVNTDCGEWELSYDTGTSGFNEGKVLTGQTSGATGVIKWLAGDDAAGTLTLKEVEGTFIDNEILVDNNTLPGSATSNGSEIQTSKTECCFEMGGCGDPLWPYPPVRQTAGARDDLDPSLAYDVSEYGHLGYNPGVGAPNPDSPVQDQYTGTWAYYRPPNDDARLVNMLADHVLAAADPPGGIVIDLGDYDLAIWDFSDNYIDTLTDNATVVYTLAQDSKGKLTGEGTFRTADNMTNIPVEVKGKVKLKKDIVTVDYTVKGKNADKEKMGNKYTLELTLPSDPPPATEAEAAAAPDNETMVLEGTSKGKICVNGEKCEKIEDDEVVLPVPEGMDGDAVVTVKAEYDDKGKVTSAQSSLLLSNDDLYVLETKGKFSEKKGERKFKLKGDNETTKGIKINPTIAIDSDNATKIDGKALGQKLKYKQ